MFSPIPHARAVSSTLRFGLIAVALAGGAALASEPPHAEGRRTAEGGRAVSVEDLRRLERQIRVQEADLRELRRRFVESGYEDAAGVTLTGHSELGRLDPPPLPDGVDPAPDVRGGLRFEDELDTGGAEPGLQPRQPDDVLVDPGEFQGDVFENEDRSQIIGVDFYSPGEFDGLVIRGKDGRGEDVALRIGGYVKADVIHDFDPIGSTDSFDTTTIEVDSPSRENTRLHARQSRLNFDTRWDSGLGQVRAFVEVDFFGSDRDDFRLRHAYGEVGRLIIGQTWSTFADVRSLPNTLDSEGPNSVDRRQAQVRWTVELPYPDATWSVAIEDPRILTNLSGLPSGVRLLTETPDFVTRLRLRSDRAGYQVAAVVRQLGVQVGPFEAMKTAWGLNFTGSRILGERDDVYFQITFGEGVGSYRNLPDVVASGSGQAAILPVFAWLVGVTHEWDENLHSNFTYSQSYLDNPAFQGPNELNATTYLAANLIWQPTERFFVGIEYLYGTRENFDGRDRGAHRIQSSFGFFLP